MDRKKSIFFFLFALHRTRATCTIPSKGGRPRFGARADKCQTTGSLRQGTAFGKGQPSARDSLRQGTAFGKGQPSLLLKLDQCKKKEV